MEIKTNNVISKSSLLATLLDNYIYFFQFHNIQNKLLYIFLNRIGHYLRLTKTKTFTVVFIPFKFNTRNNLICWKKYLFLTRFSYLIQRFQIMRSITFDSIWLDYRNQFIRRNFIIHIILNNAKDKEIPSKLLNIFYIIINNPYDVVMIDYNYSILVWMYRIPILRPDI